MKAEIKALIVFVVLVLSVGPLIYFFQAQNPNTDQPTVPELPYIINAVTMTGEITDLEDYLIYNGVSQYNNPDYVNMTLFETLELKEDIKANMQLNDGPEGGYRYHMKIKIPTSTTPQELGLKLAYNFQPFFTLSDLWPVRMGKIKLPEKIDIEFEEGKKSIDFGSTEAGFVSLYWQNIGSTVKIYCPQMKFDRETYEYLGNLDYCYDITPTEKLGATETMISGLTEKMTKQELRVKVVKGAYFETPEKADLNAEKVWDALSEWYTMSTLKVRQEDGKFKIDVDYIDEEKTTKFIPEKLGELGLKVTDSFKEGYVALPYFLTVGAETYDMRYQQLQNAKLKIDTRTNEYKEFNIYTKAKYEQLLDIRIEEVGS